MAKSKNGATEPGNNLAPSKDEDPKTEAGKAQAGAAAPRRSQNGKSRQAAEAGRVAPARARNSRKDSARQAESGQGKGGGPKTKAGKAQAGDGASRRAKNGKSRQGQGGGPKTPEGKARSALNALKHGIHAMHPVVIADFESVEEWDEFYDGYRESLQPQGTVEEDIVYNLAANRWRQRRVIHAETAGINEQVWKTADDLGFADAYANSIIKEHDPAQLPDPDPVRVLLRQQSRVIPTTTSLDRLVRYESHLHRVCSQLHIQLEVLQARRQGKPTPFHRVDITSPPQFRNSTRRAKLPDALANLA